MTFVALELGGSAGAVVASRLSDIPEWKVLLLEAGPDEPPGAEVPSMVAMFLGKFQLNLFYVQSAILFRYLYYKFRPCYDNEYLKCIEIHIALVWKSVSSFISLIDIGNECWKKYFGIFHTLYLINF